MVVIKKGKRETNVSEITLLEHRIQILAMATMLRHLVSKTPVDFSGRVAFVY